MARRATPLTARQVTTLKQGTYGDGNGLFLVVKESGSRSWEVRYQVPGQKRHSVGIGGVDKPYSLAEAREKAREIQKQAKLGVDVLTEKHRQKEVVLAPKTFRYCAEGFFKSRQATWSKRHAHDWPKTMELHAYPYIGDKSVQEIELADILRVLQPIWRTKPETANRVRNRIEASLDWAIAMDHRTITDNPARWAGKLKMLLPAPSRAAEAVRRETGRNEHYDALPWQDMPAFLTQLREQKSVSARALEWTVLTASRTTQAAVAVWDEIDFEARVWTVPAVRMKNRQVHRVPLSEQAMTILATQKEFCSYFSTQYVFPGVVPMRPIHRNSMYVLLTRGMTGYENITVHGFRSTFRQWVADNRLSRDAAEMALAHTLGGVEAAYQRSDLLEERRHLMEAWAKFIAGEGSTVIEFPARRA